MIRPHAPWIEEELIGECRLDALNNSESAPVAVTIQLLKLSKSTDRVRFSQDGIDVWCATEDEVLHSYIAKGLRRGLAAAKFYGVPIEAFKRVVVEELRYNKSNIDSRSIEVATAAATLCSVGLNDKYVLAQGEYWAIIIN